VVEELLGSRSLGRVRPKGMIGWVRKGEVRVSYLGFYWKEGKILTFQSKAIAKRR
jgi:hypothetical protein